MSDQLELTVIVSEMFAENAYLARLSGRNDCLVIDPGLDVAKIIEHLEHHRLTPAAILNTHGHADHIAGNSAMKQRWPDCPLVIGRGDAPKLSDPMQNLSGQFGFGLVSPPADQLVSEGDVYEAAGLALEVFDTPGHSQGHVIFVWRAHDPIYVFGGDVLFQGSIGRTDFPDGSFTQLESSIQTKIYTLPDNTIILPGHGERTTVGQEKRTNPFVNVG